MGGIFDEGPFDENVFGQDMRELRDDQPAWSRLQQRACRFARNEWQGYVICDEPSIRNGKEKSPDVLMYEDDRGRSPDAPLEVAGDVKCKQRLEQADVDQVLAYKKMYGPERTTLFIANHTHVPKAVKANTVKNRIEIWRETASSDDEGPEFEQEN